MSETSPERATERGGTLGKRERTAVVLLVAATAIAVFLGWRLLWFLTDDAFIAFRYISNSIAGWGYVWNPPPFAPVEGYTSFAWVVLLDGVWRFTGVEPPVAANWISLALGYATLFIVARMFWRMRLPEPLRRHRLAALSLVLLGTVTNRTTLAWLSSGLETALFNFSLTAWIYFGTAPREHRGRHWILGLSGFAGLTALTRPDGLLFFVATLACIALHLWRRGPSPASSAAVPSHEGAVRQLAWAAPLIVVPAHLIWRFATYGSWLPNTYYAKHVAAWPESGVRYMASFLLEYSLWIWIWLGALVVVAELRRGGLGSRARRALLDPYWITLGAVVGQVGYYTLNIGGDHFEYRVYSYLIPLLFLSSVWLAARWMPKPSLMLTTMGLLVVLSWPIPWVHWWYTKDLVSLGATGIMIVPIARHFPAALRPPVEAWDELQLWLISHMVGSRHQEHKVFYELRVRQLPARGETNLRWEDRDVILVGGVGVVGWVLPQAAIIDYYGLNDPIVARSTRDTGRGVRLMAHDRMAPKRYTSCYRPNLAVKDGHIIRTARTLTDAKIKACQLIRW